MKNFFIFHVLWKFQIVWLRCSSFFFLCKKSFQLMAERKKKMFYIFPMLFWIFSVSFSLPRSPNYSLNMCVSSSPPTISLLHPFWVSPSICFVLQPHFWAYWSLCPCPNFFSRLNSFPFLAIFLLTQSKLPLHLPRAIFLPNPKYSNCAMKVS